MGTYVQIVGWGKYVPSDILSNRDLEQIVETSEEWILSRTGIRERRIAGAEETASTMALEAARNALAVARIPSQELDLIIVATSTPEHLFPACASLVQEGLGASKAAAFDLNAACSGFVYALTTAAQFIRAGVYRQALVIGSEVYSRILNWQDRSTCILFGDGAGAVVVQASDRPGGLLSFVLGSDGSGAELLYALGPGAKPRERSENGLPHVVMNGREVFRFGVTAMVQASRQAASAAGLDLSQVSLFLPHQANARIIQTAAKALGFPESKVFMNMERYGNTAAASIPIALCEAVEQGRVHQGDHLLMVGCGAGLNWAASVVQWNNNV